MQRRQALVFKVQRESLKNDDLSSMVEKAMATSNDDELDQVLLDRYGEGITDRMRYLDEEDREMAIRARVETLSRPELVQFEQMVLIETLDTSWKDHLYSMDQLRDTIGFRAIAQTDPKIEFKREGQRMFQSMMREMREKVTGYIFKARLAAPPPPRGQQPMQRPAPVGAGAGNRPPQQQRPAAPRPAAPGNIIGSSIVGPGFAAGPMMTSPKPAQSPKPAEEGDEAGTKDEKPSS